VLCFTDCNSPANYTPIVPVATIRTKSGANVKVMITIGGWGAKARGFSGAASSASSGTNFAKQVQSMLNITSADGVDIDWECPGDNGQDYKSNPNRGRTSEVETYPLLLAVVREVTGPKKLVSNAVPRKEGDMMAFTAETEPNIWKSVDFVNESTALLRRLHPIPIRTNIPHNPAHTHLPP
jgi:chitinase